MADDLLSQLLNFNGNSNQPTQWGMNPYPDYNSAPGDSSGAFGGLNNNSNLMAFLSSLNKGGSANGSGLGFNLPTINAGIQGIAQLGGLYMGLKQLGLARDSFNLQKRAYNTNLKSQTQSYNTQVTDRINGRSYNTEDERQAALKAALLQVGG